ncbi:MAG TPA: transposase family protein [bacterium]|nr:transposase family protein [bacterium]
MDKEGAFWHHFSDMQDPRMNRTKRHKLVDILFIATAVIAGADTFVEV